MCKQMTCLLWAFLLSATLYARQDQGQKPSTPDVPTKPTRPTGKAAIMPTIMPISQQTATIASSMYPMYSIAFPPLEIHAAASINAGRLPGTVAACLAAGHYKSGPGCDPDTSFTIHLSTAPIWCLGFAFPGATRSGR